MFVGRTAEIELLRALAEQAGEGLGGAAWVEGEPGIGKSALIAAALNGAEGYGCRICYGSASEQSPLFPLQVLLEALGVGASSATPEESEPDPVLRSRTEIGTLLLGTRAEVLAPLSVTDLLAERLVTLVHRPIGRAHV